MVGNLRRASNHLVVEVMELSNLLRVSYAREWDDLEPGQFDCFEQFD